MGISTAIKTALKVARGAQILGKRRPVSKNKRLRFFVGTKCKISLNFLLCSIKESSSANVFSRRTFLLVDKEKLNDHWKRISAVVQSQTAFFVKGRNCIVLSNLY